MIVHKKCKHRNLSENGSIFFKGPVHASEQDEENWGNLSYTPYFRCEDYEFQVEKLVGPRFHL